MQPATPGEPSPDSASPPRFSATLTGECLILSGPLRVQALSDPAMTRSAATIDASAVTALDTAGAWFLEKARRGGCKVMGLPQELQPLLKQVAASWPQRPKETGPPRGSLRGAVEQLGRHVGAAIASLLALVEYLGRFLAALARALRHPRQFPLTSLVYHCQAVGLNAVPIVVTISFLIGVVIAYQGAYQLRAFGAEIFTIDLVGIAVLRELAILLTAIVVAGRTGAAFTAALGAMKMREEIDAMRTLDIDPDQTLILPRVLALTLMMPILALIGDIAGLFGGGVMAWAALDISPAIYVARLSQNVDVTHAFVGLVKAPVFGMLIAIIGCRFGMQVGGDTESLGRMTSASVVAAIFAVIVADAGFSIFFAQVGL